MNDMNPHAEHRTVFRPERIHLLVVVLMACIIAIPFSHAPLVLAWAWLLPAAYLWWVLRVATTVDDSGITARYALRAPVHVNWEDIAGIGFTGARAFLRRTTTAQGRERVALPAVTFNDLPALSEASRGRIPDALTAGREAADDMITIVRRDGSERLVTREEYAAMKDEQDQ